MYSQLNRQKIRVVLDFDVYEDFEPDNINWNKVFEIEGDEQLNVQVERFSPVENVW